MYLWHNGILRSIAQETQMETKPININESDYNTLTLIAKRHGYVYPEGHALAGRMNPRKTFEHVLKVYAGAIS